jgi:hypothetical protein
MAQRYWIRDLSANRMRRLEGPVASIDPPLLMVQPEIFQPKSQTADQPPFVSTASRGRVFPMATGDLGSAPCSCVRSLCFLCGLVWRCVCSDEGQSWNADRCHWRRFPAANGWFVPPKLSSRAKLSANLREVGEEGLDASYLRTVLPCGHSRDQHL